MLKKSLILMFLLFSQYLLSTPYKYDILVYVEVKNSKSADNEGAFIYYPKNKKLNSPGDLLAEKTALTKPNGPIVNDLANFFNINNIKTKDKVVILSAKKDGGVPENVISASKLFKEKPIIYTLNDFYDNKVSVPLNKLAEPIQNESLSKIKLNTSSNIIRTPSKLAIKLAALKSSVTLTLTTIAVMSSSSLSTEAAIGIVAFNVVFSALTNIFLETIQGSMNFIINKFKNASNNEIQKLIKDLKTELKAEGLEYLIKTSTNNKNTDITESTILSLNEIVDQIKDKETLTTIDIEKISNKFSLIIQDKNISIEEVNALTEAIYLIKSGNLKKLANINKQIKKEPLLSLNKIGSWLKKGTDKIKIGTYKVGTKVGELLILAPIVITMVSTNRLISGEFIDDPRGTLIRTLTDTALIILSEVPTSILFTYLQKSAAKFRINKTIDPKTKDMLNKLKNFDKDLYKKTNNLFKMSNSKSIRITNGFGLSILTGIDFLWTIKNRFRDAQVISPFLYNIINGGIGAIIWTLNFIVKKKIKKPDYINTTWGDLAKNKPELFEKTSGLINSIDIEKAKLSKPPIATYNISPCSKNITKVINIVLGF